MTTKPRKPWRVILTQNGVKLAEIEHTSEAKAYSFLREKLGDGDATTAKVMQWEGGRWWHFETVTADEIPDA